MNERIKLLRKTLKLTQAEFGERLGVANNTITTYETSVRVPSSAVITSICREFNVNEEWLLNGTGEMFNELSDEELAAKYVGRLFAGKDPFIINTIKALGKLRPEQWEVLKELVDNIKGE